MARNVEDQKEELMMTFKEAMAKFFMVRKIVAYSLLFIVLEWLQILIQEERMQYFFIWCINDLCRLMGIMSFKRRGVWWRMFCTFTAVMLIAWSTFYGWSKFFLFWAFLPFSSRVRIYTPPCAVLYSSSAILGALRPQSPAVVSPVDILNNKYIWKMLMNEKIKIKAEK